MVEGLSAVWRMPAGRRIRAAAAVAAVVAVHAALVLPGEHPTPAAPRNAQRGALTVVSVVSVTVRPDAPLPPESSAPATEPVAQSAQPPAVAAGAQSDPLRPDSDVPGWRGTGAGGPLSAASAGRSDPVASGPATDPGMSAATGASTESSASEVFDAESAASGEGDTPPPLYQPQLPGSAQLTYALRRGQLQGEARLSWYTDGARYRLEFRSRSGALPLADQVSEGVIDRHGVAPERFVDRRRRRAAQAANFLRDEGRIVYSGNSAEHRAWPGAQDRLGWILQLVGIHEAAAAAGQAAPAELSFFVVGARGGAGNWTFRLRGREQVDTPMGPVQALWLRREPDRLEDLRVDVWLDPARGHWPVRLRLTPLRGGPPLELTLAAEPGP